MYLRSPNVTVLEIWPDIFIIQGTVIGGYLAMRSHVLVNYRGSAIRIITQDLIPDDILGSKRALPEVIALHQE